MIELLIQNKTSKMTMSINLKAVFTFYSIFEFINACVEYLPPNFNILQLHERKSVDSVVHLIYPVIFSMPLIIIVEVNKDKYQKD